MPQDGTSLLRFKKKLIQQLESRVSNVNYESPLEATDLLGDDGTGAAIWWEDAATTTETIKIITGGPQQIDETVRPVLCIQVLGQDTDDIQQIVDQRATELLGEVIGLLASDPSLGIPDDSKILMFTGLPVSWNYTAGITLQQQRGCRFDLTIEIYARLQLQAS